MQQEQLKKLKRSRNKNPPYKSSLSLLIQGVIEASYMVLSTFQENPCSVLIVLPFKFSQHTNKIRRKYFQLHFYSLPQRRNGWRGEKRDRKYQIWQQSCLQVSSSVELYDQIYKYYCIIKPKIQILQVARHAQHDNTTILTPQVSFWRRMLCRILEYYLMDGIPGVESLFLCQASVLNHHGS